MKNILIIVTLLFVCNAICLSQCDKKLILHASKTEYLDADSVLQKAVDENTIIEITRPGIIISPGDKKMTGTINSDTCDWKIPFIEGKTILNATFKDEQGTTRNVIITIEGKDGKLGLLVRTEGMPYLIRVPIDQFEEGK
ncbi:MAG: hypothetical protein ABI707_04515 [Ferruginibacter sp.]